MSERNKKFERQSAICNLIKNERITDQKLIVQRLKEQYRIEANQAMISKDLHDLKIIKKAQDGGHLVYELPNFNVDQEILKLAIKNVEHNEMMIVIHTRPGLAAFVGDFLDRCVDLELLGSLAGENVVFVAPKSIQHIETVYRQLCDKIFFMPK